MFSLDDIEFYEQLGNLAQARAYYNTCLELNPDEYRTGLHQKAKTGLARIGDWGKSCNKDVEGVVWTGMNLGVERGEEGQPLRMYRPEKTLQLKIKSQGSFTAKNFVLK